MITYVLEGHSAKSLEETVSALPGESGTVKVLRYRNAEMHINISPSPKGKSCLLMGTTAPPDSRLLEMLLVADTLRKEGALRLTVLTPYFGYARHDKNVSGKSMATALLGKLLVAAGIDDIVTFDIHSDRDMELMKLPIVSLSTDGLFADIIRREGLMDATMVAPDNGAIARCERVRQEAAMEESVLHLQKVRVHEKVVRKEFTGSAKKRAIIVDDMLDTGETMVSACEILKKAGVVEITIFVTHGLFTGDGWMRLKEIGVTRLYCTDTLPMPEHALQKWITVLPVSAIITEHFGS